MRRCDQYNIPVATNIATAELLILGLALRDPFEIIGAVYRFRAPDARPAQKSLQFRLTIVWENNGLDPVDVYGQSLHSSFVFTER